MHARRITPLLLLLTLAAAPARAGGGDEHGWDQWIDCDRSQDPGIKHCEERDAEWNARGSTIRVYAGRNGGVSVNGWDRDFVRVKATLKVRGVSEREAQEIARQVKIQMDEDQVTATGPENLHGWSVVFRIWAPRKSNLELRAENGPVGARNVTGKLRLTTHNGPVSLIGVSGDVVGRTQNGPMNVRLEGRRWVGTGLDAETINGPVILEIPKDYNAVLQSGTQNGPWDVNLPVRVRRGRWFTMELGGGGRPVRVVTHNGPVSIAEN